MNPGRGEPQGKGSKGEFVLELDLDPVLSTRGRVEDSYQIHSRSTPMTDPHTHTAYPYPATHLYDDRDAPAGDGCLDPCAPPQAQGS